MFCNKFQPEIAGKYFGQNFRKYRRADGRTDWRSGDYMHPRWGTRKVFFCLKNLLRLMNMHLYNLLYNVYISNFIVFVFCILRTVKCVFCFKLVSLYVYMFLCLLKQQNSLCNSFLYIKHHCCGCKNNKLHVLLNEFR